MDEFVGGGGQAQAPGGRGGKDWELPFREVFEVLGYLFQRAGKGTQGIEKTLRKGMGSWWRDAEIYRSRSVFFENEMPAGDQPCLQHCTEQ